MLLLQESQGRTGPILTEFLLDKGYEVHGLIRRASTFNTNRIDHLYQDSHIDGVSLFLHYDDLTDASNLSRLFEKIQPDEIYNLGAQSHVRVSFDVPEYSADSNALGVQRILDVVRRVKDDSRPRDKTVFGIARIDYPQKFLMLRFCQCHDDSVHYLLFLNVIK